jgi:hypothetical protein
VFRKKIRSRCYIRKSWHTHTHTRTYAKVAYVKAACVCTWRSRRERRRNPKILGTLFRPIASRIFFSSLTLFFPPPELTRGRTFSPSPSNFLSVNFHCRRACYKFSRFFPLPSLTWLSRSSFLLRLLHLLKLVVLVSAKRANCFVLIVWRTKTIWKNFPLTISRIKD